MSQVASNNLLPPWPKLSHVTAGLQIPLSEPFSRPLERQSRINAPARGDRTPHRGERSQLLTAGEYFSTETWTCSESRRWWLNSIRRVMKSGRKHSDSLVHNGPAERWFLFQISSRGTCKEKHYYLEETYTALVFEPSGASEWVWRRVLKKKNPFSLQSLSFPGSIEPCSQESVQTDTRPVDHINTQNCDCRYAWGRTGLPGSPPKEVLKPRTLFLLLHLAPGSHLHSSLPYPWDSPDNTLFPLGHQSCPSLQPPCDGGADFLPLLQF